MAEAPSDWKVDVTLDRKAIVKDITKLVELLARQRMSVMVFASSREDAMEKAGLLILHTFQIPALYAKHLVPRRLPT